jgi:phosphinothricin acetyltransferase
MTLRIRPAAPADAEAIARIHSEGIADRVATFETTPTSPDEAAAMVSRSPLILAAEREGEVLGFARAGPYCDRAAYYEGVGEATVYVGRDARGAGVGRELLEGLAAEAERHGLYKLVGKVFSSNRVSLELFESLGWREVGVHRRHGRLDGEWKDVVVVELLLGQALD